MKTVNRICQILSIVFGVVSLALFFFDFATITSAGKEYTAIGAQLAFGSKLEGMASGIAKSADILFCFWLTVFGIAASGLAVKFKKARYVAPALGLITGVYMLVIALSDAHKFVDARPIVSDTGNAVIAYAPFVLLCAIALFVFAGFGIAYLLISDHIEVADSKKLSIPQRIVRFFRDYKSEIKKIVWPGINDVIKNTVIVLVMCLIVGALIWLVDFGLGRLLELILGA